MEPKNPGINPQNKLETENKQARIILIGDAHELQKMFDFCTGVSGDVYPKSATPVGEGKQQERNGKVYTTYDTLQTNYFPQIFDILKDTNFFKNRMQELLGGTSYEAFLDASTKLLQEGDDNSNIPKELIEKIIDVTIKFASLHQDSIQPRFDFGTDKEIEEARFKNSDIIINLLNKINTKAQIIKMQAGM